MDNIFGNLDSVSYIISTVKRASGAQEIEPLKTCDLCSADAEWKLWKMFRSIYFSPFDHDEILLPVRDFPTLPATKTKYFIRMEVIYGAIELHLKMIVF